MKTAFNERTWLEWLVKVRVIIITFLIAIQFAIVTLTATNVNKALFLGLMITWYAASGFYIVWLRTSNSLQLQAKAQILTDIVFATAVIYVTGGIDTSFAFLYPLVIIMASVLLSQTWAYLVAALSFIAYGAVLELSFFDLIPSFSLTHPDPRTLQAIILINLFAFLVLAYLAGRLATRLRQANVELQDKQDALEDLQALHENIVNSISGGLITTDLERHIKVANPSARTMLGEERVEGRVLDQFFIDPLPSENSGFLRREARAISSGKEKIFAITVSPLRVAERGIVGHVYTMDDLTEIRRLEAEVRRRERLAAVGRLASGIAHEIRNPLSSIAGSVKVLSNIAALTDDQRKLVDIVTKESDRLNMIITDFLDYSREKKLQMRPVDLVGLLQETVTLLQNRQALLAPHEHHSAQNPLKVETAFNLSSAWAYGEGDKLKQIFWNVCQNAVRAMPNGGTLTVSIDDDDGDHWRIGFVDDGVGMSAKQLEKVFEPFQSGFEGGTGLGLAIVYQIIEAHEAEIDVRSEQGVGTEIVMRFARAEHAMLARAPGISAGARD